jgi:hypothetical protein
VVVVVVVVLVLGIVASILIGRRGWEDSGLDFHVASAGLCLESRI